MRKALVVGINDYPRNELYGCISDANEVERLLKKNGDGSPNFDVKKLTKYLRKGELKQSIIDLFNGNNEIALLYFSGHGHVDANGHSYIVTSDYAQNDYGVSLSEILDIANQSKTKNKIIILDSCYSGAMGSLESFGIEGSLLGRGLTILTSSLHSEPSAEVKGHGLFTSLLIEALEGGAADVIGQISPGSIYAYIEKALGSWEQRPVFKTNVSSFVPLRKVKPLIPMDCLRKITEYFSNPNEEMKLDPSFEYTNTLDNNIIPVEPYANQENVKILKDLQKMVSVGLVKPVDEDHMYFAAMNSKNCKLTAAGKHFWDLVVKNKI